MNDFEGMLRLGEIADGVESPTFQLTEQLLKTHLGIFGGTRQGKSKLFELICRELVMNRRGLAFIDPHSDTADDLLAFLASHSREFPVMKRKVHYLNPGDRLFSFDPFLYRPGSEEAGDDPEFAYKRWLHTKIRDMSRIIVRQQGETEDEANKTVRLRRWLYNGLYAVGVRQDASGTHLPMKDIFILLNPSDPLHLEKYALVAPHLSDVVRADFEKLHKTKDPRKQEDWVESTINRLREMFSPTVERIFNMEAPSIDFCEIIARGEILLASLGKTNYFHEDDGMAIAGLLIRQLSEAVRTVDRANRKQFYLFIDEAHNYLGDDLIRLMKESGKYKLSFGLAVQGLDNLQKGQIDMVPAVLGQCGIRITFRQQFHEHAEVLAKSLCYTMLDFTELLQEAERDDGYNWEITQSASLSKGIGSSLQYGISKSQQDSSSQSIGFGLSEGISASQGITRSRGVTNSRGKTSTRGRSVSIQRNRSTGNSHSFGVNEGHSRQQSVGTSESIGFSAGTSSSTSFSEQHSHTEGTSDSRGQSRNESQGEGQSRSGTEKLSVSQNRNTGNSNNQSSGRSRADSESDGISRGEGQSQSESVNFGKNRSTSAGINNSTNESFGVTHQEGESVGESTSESYGITESRSDSVSLAISQSKGTNRARSRQWGKGISRSLGRSRTRSKGESESRSHSVSFQETPLHKIRVVQQRTGRLEVGIPDQFARFTHAISSLQKQHCMVAVAAFNSAFILRVGTVVPAFESTLMSDKFQQMAIAKFKEELFSLRPYYFKSSDRRFSKPDINTDEVSDSKSPFDK